MSNPLLRTPFGQVELRPVAAPAGAPEGMRVYVLLPDLDELLGVPGLRPARSDPGSRAARPAAPLDLSLPLNSQQSLQFHG